MLASSDAANPRVPVPKIASGKLVADFSWPRFDVVKAEVAHLATPLLGKPHSQSQPTTFSIVAH